MEYFINKKMFGAVHNIFMTYFVIPYQVNDK